jgi:hypothetical protein
MSFRPLAFALCALAMGSAVALAVLEVTLRIVPGLIPLDLLVEFNKHLRAPIAKRLDLPLKEDRDCVPSAERTDGGPDLCWFRPNVVHRLLVDEVDRAFGAADSLPHDARGFCNPPGKASRERVDIVTLGDSFTWCTAVRPEETWTARLEERSGLTTYALAAPGLGPYDYLELLRIHGLALEPRFVIMMIYGGNDLRDADRFHEARREGSRREASDRKADGRERSDDGGFSLNRTSYALNFLKAAAHVGSQRLFGPAIDFRYSVALDGRRIPMNPANHDTDEVEFARRWRDGQVGFDLWKDALDQFTDLATRHGFVPIVAYVPSAYAAYSTRANGVEFADPDVGEVVLAFSEAERDWWIRATHEAGVAMVDLTGIATAGESEPQPSLAYFPANVHLTAPGHRAVAARIVGSGALGEN